MFGNKSRTGQHFKHSEKTKKKIGLANSIALLGKKRPLSVRKKISLSLLGKIDEESRAWKGEKIKYPGLHFWINKKLGKPDTCEYCGKTKLKGKKIHWANKSGKYKRELTDWIRLCVPCHYKYDEKIGRRKQK